MNAIDNGNKINKIKKQFKDFWSYYKLTKYGVNSSGTDIFKRNAAMLFSAIAVCLLMFIQFMFGDGLAFSITIFDLFIPFAVGAAIGSGILAAKQPSLLSVAPFTPKQRMVFCYFAAILRAVVLFLLGLVVLFVSIFIIGVLFSLAAGTWVFVINSSTSVTNDYATYKTWFLFLLGVIHFFAFFAIGHIKKEMPRNIASVAYGVAVLVFSLIVTNICGNAMGYSSSFFFTTNLEVGLNALKSPWVVLVIEGVLALLAIAASVFFVRKRFASTEV